LNIICIVLKQIKRVEEFPYWQIWQELAEIGIKKLPEEKRRVYEKKLEDAKYRGSKRKLEEIIEKCRKGSTLFVDFEEENIRRLLGNIPKDEREYYQTELNKAIIEGYILQIENGAVYLSDYALKLLKNLPYPESEIYKEKLKVLFL